MSFNSSWQSTGYRKPNIPTFHADLPSGVSGASSLVNTQSTQKVQVQLQEEFDLEKVITRIMSGDLSAIDELKGRVSYRTNPNPPVVGKEYTVWIYNDDGTVQELNIIPRATGDASKEPETGLKAPEHKPVFGGANPPVLGSPVELGSPVILGGWGNIGTVQTPPTLTPEQIEAEVQNITREFTSGNMTIAQLEEALAKLGITISLQQDVPVDEFPGKYYVEFTANGKERCLVCDKAAIEDGKGGQTQTTWTPEQIQELGLSNADFNKYFYGVAWTEGNAKADLYTKSQQWPEGVNTLEDLKWYVYEQNMPKNIHFADGFLEQHNLGSEFLSQYFVREERDGHQGWVLKEGMTIKDANGKDVPVDPNMGRNDVMRLFVAPFVYKLKEGVPADLIDNFFKITLDANGNGTLKLNDEYVSYEVKANEDGTKSFVLKAKDGSETTYTIQADGSHNNGVTKTAEQVATDTRVAQGYFASEEDMNAFIDSLADREDFRQNYPGHAPERLKGLAEDIKNYIKNDADWTKMTKSILEEEFQFHCNRLSHHEQIDGWMDYVKQEDISHWINDGVNLKYNLTSEQLDQLKKRVAKLCEEDIQSLRNADIDSQEDVEAWVRNHFITALKEIAEAQQQNKGDFKNVGALRNHIFSDIKPQFDNKNGSINLDAIAEAVYQRHTSDWQNVTKAQLLEEFQAEYNQQVSTTTNPETQTPATPTTDPENPTPAKPGATGEFFDYEALKFFLKQNNLNTIANKAGIPSPFNETLLQQAIDNVLAKHTTDANTLTQAQVLSELKAEYDALAQGYKNNCNEWRTGAIDHLIDYLKAGNAYRYVSTLTDLTETELAQVRAKLEEKVSLDLVMNTIKPGSLRDTIDYISQNILTDILKEIATTRANADELLGDDHGATDYLVKLEKIKKSAQELISDTYWPRNTKVNVWVDDLSRLYLNGGKNINTRHTVTSDGELTFDDTKTGNIYNRLYTYIEDALDDNRELFNVIGSDNLEKLFRSAWVAVSAAIENPKASDLQSFVDGVLRYLKNMLSDIANDGYKLDFYTDFAYEDPTLTAITDSKNITGKEGHTIVVDITYLTNNNGSIKRYNSDGKIHLNDTTSDKHYQKLMDQLLEAIYNKYRGIGKEELKTLFLNAQEDALIDMKTRKTKVDLEWLADNILMRFDALMKEKEALGGFTTRQSWENDAPAVRGVTTTLTQEELSSIKADATHAGITNVINIAKKENFLLDMCITEINKTSQFMVYEASTMHTEFGIDKNGNLRFQDNSETGNYTKIVYEKMLSFFNGMYSMNSEFKAAIDNLGGESVIQDLLNTAWIMTYNQFNSSTSHTIKDFVNAVINNLQDIVNKLKENPEYIEVVKAGLAYGDMSLLKDVPVYDGNGKDITVNWGGTAVVYDDGTVHLHHNDADDYYQGVMSGLLKNILASPKYATVPTDVIKTVFRQAQQLAIKTAQKDTRDLPFGIGRNDTVTGNDPSQWDHDGKDYRDGDSIHLDQIAQLTLYYFDKLLYANLFDQELYKEATKSLQ